MCRPLPLRPATEVAGSADGSVLKHAREAPLSGLPSPKPAASAAGIATLLSLVLLSVSWASAQTTLTFTGTLPFDLNGFGDVSVEGGWQWQRAPWTVGASATLTAKSFESAKLSLSYQISRIQASATATLTPQGLTSAETQLKAEFPGLISLENTLNFWRRGFKNGKVTVKLGPSQLNVTGGAQLTPEGIVAPTGNINFSLARELGELSGTTTFTAHGFKQQSLSAVGYLSDDWTLTMTSLITTAGFQSESFDLATTLWDERVSLSLSVTIESHGITGEGISLDLMLDGLFVQASIDFSGLELSGFQIMANGFVGDFSIDAFVMGSLDGIQFATCTASGELFGFSVSASVDMSVFGLDHLSMSVSRALGRWRFSAEGTVGSDGFQGGALKASYTLKI
ncbi:MAG: hypothetical protein N3E42_00840 [Candidatus Bipolaricaulota bacterium]|nr:hypothetical protein [Candidatus Bipolaricaulota bacterium]